jgi:Family of unknown function (DUF6636)
VISQTIGMVRLVRHRRAGLAALVISVAVGLGGVQHALAQSQAPCTEQAAIAAATPLDLVSDPQIAHPVSVLCGEFLGSGSHAMVVTINHGVCEPNFGWVVFRDEGGTWRMLTPPGHVNHVVWPMTAIGGDIRERWEVYRRGDGPCTPSGGTRSRLWHWDGGSLVAGTAKRIANPLGGNPGNPAASAEGYFKTPSGNIICFFSTGSDALVVCGIRSGLKPGVPAHHCRDGGSVHDRIVLPGSGRASVPRCAGDPGPFVGYHEHSRTLSYGKRWRGAGLRCTSAKRGLTCRNRGRHGFFLSRNHWRRF